MPRTKRPVKKSLKAAESGEKIHAEFLKKLEKEAEEHKKLIDDCAQMQARNIDIAFKIFLGSIKKEYMSMTIGQMKNELFLKEVTNTISPTTTRHHSDDGYNTETSQGSGDRAARKVMGPPSSSRTQSARRSRSADPSRKTATQARPATANRRRSKSMYRTPMYNKSANVYPAITPKVAPHTPLTVLRQPRAGEMVVSMTGSPVMVPSYSTMSTTGEDVANCNIMLRDGTVLSVQPKQLRQSQAFIPFSLMDKNVLQQLKTLQDNLQKVVQLGEKAFK